MAAEQQKHNCIWRPVIFGDIMLYPLSLWAYCFTLFPRVLEIGSFTTAVAKGAPAIVGIVLLFVEPLLTLRRFQRFLKTGLTILIPKLAIAIAFGLFCCQIL